LPRAERSAIYLLSICLGCGSASPGGDTAQGRGERGEVRIPREVVSRIERTVGVQPAQALALASEDALLAHELERTDAAGARSLVTLAHARVLLDTLRSDVAREHPVTDSELEAMAAERWWEFDRPRMVRVIHAVVRSEAEDAAAQALASQIRDAVLGSTSPAEFKKAAEQVPAGSSPVRIELLPPIAEDGRSVELSDPPPAGAPVVNMAREFAVAANRLEKQGEVSPVVRSPFGYHVIQLIEIVPAHVLAPAERRTRLGAEVVSERARKQTEELLERLRRELAPVQSRAAVAAMENVRAEP
jgi:peptidyl-prolyl cis-trans isomerase C